MARPKVLKKELIDEIIAIPDDEAGEMSRHFEGEEELLFKEYWG